jgi:nitrogen regulatory protein PII 2
MKEIIAVIRPKMAGKTRDALERLGIFGITALPVFGRGKQKGISGEVNIEYRPHILEGHHSGMKYIPKRQLSMVVQDDTVDEVVKAIVEVNQTGQIGDGKIFVCPVEDGLRVRTGETGNAAIV